LDDTAKSSIVCSIDLSTAHVMKKNIIRIDIINGMRVFFICFSKEVDVNARGFAYN